MAAGLTRAANEQTSTFPCEFHPKLARPVELTVLLHRQQRI